MLLDSDTDPLYEAFESYSSGLQAAKVLCQPQNQVCLQRNYHLCYINEQHGLPPLLPTVPDQCCYDYITDVHHYHQGNSKGGDKQQVNPEGTEVCVI